MTGRAGVEGPLFDVVQAATGLLMTARLSRGDDARAELVELRRLVQVGGRIDRAVAVLPATPPPADDEDEGEDLVGGVDAEVVEW